MNLEFQQGIVDGLLFPIYEGVSNDYKQKYSYTIWTQFENEMRAASYSNANLPRFFDMLTQRMGVRIKHVRISKLNEFMSKGNDRDVLKVIREQSALLVAMLREKNSALKEKRQAKRETSYLDLDEIDYGGEESANDDN